MTNVKIESNGDTYEFNAAGAIVIAIRPVKDGEKLDFGLGIHGNFSLYDAMETIVEGTKELFKTYTNKYGVDQMTIRRAFQEMVREELSPEELTMTATVEINKEMLEAITGMKGDNPAKDIEISPLPTEKGWS